MKKQLAIFLAGAAIVAPITITIYVLLWIGGELSHLGLLPFQQIVKNLEQSWLNHLLLSLAGIVIVVGVIYFIGLLARFWVFRTLLGLMERLITRLPGAKTIYESVRDLMGLFGSSAGRMGRVVEYRPPGLQMSCLAILTSQAPPQIPPDAGGKRRVAIYVPFSYMLGGTMFYVSTDHLHEVDIPVEQALKFCATAHVGGMISTPASGEAEPAKQAKDKSAKT